MTDYKYCKDCKHSYEQRPMVTHVCKWTAEAINEIKVGDLIGISLTGNWSYVAMRISDITDRKRGVNDLVFVQFKVRFGPHLLQYMSIIIGENDSFQYICPSPADEEEAVAPYDYADSQWGRS